MALGEGCGVRDAGCGAWDAGRGVRGVGCGVRDAGCRARETRGAGCGARGGRTLRGREGILAAAAGRGERGAGRLIRGRYLFAGSPCIRHEQTNGS